jgi:hypothetical protein
MSEESASHTTPISEIEVGDNVLAGNPKEAPDLRFGSSVDPKTWRKIELRAPKVDGSFADVTLLRPLSWIAEQKAVAGRTVHIEVPECGIKGDAKVLSISDCPPVKSGSGKTVTGVFRHSSSKVVDVHIAGLEKPIGSTGNHPFWSEDRQEFVRADKLQPGERLRTLQGITRITNVVARGSPVPVYNIEVQVDHTYHVASTGVLVHNTGDLCDDDWLYHGTTDTQTLTTEGISLKKIREADGVEEGFSLTPDRSVAEGFANNPLHEGNPQVLRIRKSTLEERKVNLESGVELTDMNEVRIIREDFGKVRPEDFEVVE